MANLEFTTLEDKLLGEELALFTAAVARNGHFDKGFDDFDYIIKIAHRFVKFYPPNTDWEIHRETSGMDYEETVLDFFNGNY